jgi:hypothetical protein
MSEKSFTQDGVAPSAILSDGTLIVMLYAVTAMTLNQTYHLPSIGSTSARALVSTHDDTISLSGLLVGEGRYLNKQVLETMAESARRGGSIGASIANAGLKYIGMQISGISLVTSMTIRTDMQIQSLSFTASASKRQVLDVSISMIHLPKPSALAKLLDMGSVGVSALRGI